MSFALTVRSMALIDLSVLLSTLAAQAPLAAAVVLALILYVERRLGDLRDRLESSLGSVEHRLENRLSSLELRLSGIESKLSSLELGLSDLRRAVVSLIEFNESLLSVLLARGAVLEPEYAALSRLLHVCRPAHSSRYYTKEVYDRLGQLLSKRPEEITWNDVFELEHICELLFKEAEVSGRRDLERYAAKLRVLIAMAKGILIKRGMMPPPGRVV